MLIDGIQVEVQDGISEEELIKIVAEEKALWQQEGKELAAVYLSIDRDEIVIKAVQRSPIKRVRRITGYLSTEDRFNSAKHAELEGRVAHL